MFYLKFRKFLENYRARNSFSWSTVFRQKIQRRFYTYNQQVVVRHVVEQKICNQLRMQDTESTGLLYRIYHRYLVHETDMQGLVSLDILRHRDNMHQRVTMLCSCFCSGLGFYYNLGGHAEFRTKQPGKLTCKPRKLIILTDSFSIILLLM